MSHFTLTLILLTLMSISVISQPLLDSSEQEAVYRVLESVNSNVNWRVLFPDDLCTSSPHGVVCDYFQTSPNSQLTTHITELNFGYVSDDSPNPPCNDDSTLNISLYSPFTHLKKLFFYKCFSSKLIIFPNFSSLPSLEELVFIENPSLKGDLNGKISSLKILRRFILTGSLALNGDVSESFHGLENLEQLTMSRNGFKGEIERNCFRDMKKLKILDLSGNGFTGNVPDSIGDLASLLKLDLSRNEFSGEIPVRTRGINGSLEFLDLSYNKFGNFGVPLFLGEMVNLKEVYLSGNLLGGKIPEIWGKLGGILGIGLSGVGLVGEIPKSMGVHLRNVCYLGLDNNSLEGFVPREFGGLGFLSELNLENNKLTGRVPFDEGFLGRVGSKLKLGGNFDLCVDEGLKLTKVVNGGDLGRIKVCRRQVDVPKNALFYDKNYCPRRHVSFALILSLGVLILFVLEALF